MISLIFTSMLFSFFQFSTPTHTLDNLVQQEPFYAKIESSQTDVKLEVIGKFINNSEGAILIKYEMKTNKISSSGKSLSTQSGTYTSEPNSELVLTKVGLNVDNETRYEIILKVFKDEDEISADSLNYIPENQ